MRNELFTLDTETAAHAETIRAWLMTAVSEGITVHVTGTKRDGSPFDRTGDIVGFVGAYGMSSEAVLIDTDKGPRTFNVWSIRTVEVV